MPRQKEVTASAPATIGNVGPGFDVLGLATGTRYDRVTARTADHGEVRIVGIEGDGGELPWSPTQNTAAVAAHHTRLLAGRADAGFDLFLSKGIPLESGMGGSAASAVAAAHAVNVLLGSPLRKADLLEPCVEAEAAVSGRHADNVAPALFGGLVLVRPGEFDAGTIQRLPVPEGLHVSIVCPHLRVSTHASRAALPASIALSERTRTAADIATFVSACYSGELGLLATCLSDEVVTPVRLALIQGGRLAAEAALAAGALGASVSGAGPSLFAFSHSAPRAVSVRDAMLRSFQASGVSAEGFTCAGDCPGVALEPQADLRREGA